MREGLLVVFVIALLLAAAGLLLWMWAANRQVRKVTGEHLKQQIASSLASPANPLLGPLRDSHASNLAGTPLSDPWMDAATAEAQDAAPKKHFERLVPGWLEGVVSGSKLALIAFVIAALVILSGTLGGWPAALGALVFLLVLVTFGLWFRLQKHRRQIVSQLPAFIDGMVRLITIGNSTQAAFQLAIASTRAPLRGHLDRAATLVRAGVDLDHALHQAAARVRIEEMYLLASILGLGVRYGGRADLLLERVANFMRDREQAQHELVALSAETRLSAWILGLLPVCVGAVIITLNPAYFLRMWDDATGQYLVIGAVTLQVLGALLLYRLARLA